LVPAPAISPKTKWVCDVLAREKLLRLDQVEAVLAHAQRTGDRAEDAAIDLGFVAEADLLKSLAAEYRVYFISSERLSKADVPRAVRDMIPQRFAEKIGVCPVVFDGKALSVVTADPDDLEVLREVQLASGAREVKAVLARPGAVRAMMAKTYG